MSLPSGQYKIISRENGLSLGRGQEDLSLKPKRIMTLSDDMPLKTDVVELAPLIVLPVFPPRYPAYELFDFIPFKDEGANESDYSDSE
ncbi:hypothetical protein NLI96_g12346 [Meripilus lineatus]|uniref:Uncharacterized protein n=1 Tax=Meripilus lineatus TaxID=2056292 RepID=A0AAD5UQ33_9APHY|nr:hypothetical protein NLI96_g12346 [Physisporinus lineatus]